MRKLPVFICLQLLTLFLFVSISAQDFKTVQDGVEYAELERTIDKAPVRMNLLRLDLTKVRLDVMHAMDSAIGVEKTSSIAARHGALAAINAGFFRLDTSIFAGDAAGVLMIDRKIVSEPYANRVALFINNKPAQTEVVIDHFTNQQSIEIKKQKIQISGLNRERKTDEIIIYTPFFFRTTLTNPDGVEIVVRNNKIRQILDRKGSSEIPADGFVISASGKMRDELLKSAKLGLKVRWLETFTGKLIQDGGITAIPARDVNQTYSTFEDVTNGVPQLIRDGKIAITWQQEKTSKAFVETRHPRTAVAKLKDGKFLMITVDGRSESSGGIGLEDLARLLLEFGATDAMNLDGGGSTTMFLDGKVVNKPSDKEGERRVSDAILVFPRKK